MNYEAPEGLDFENMDLDGMDEAALRSVLEAAEKEYALLQETEMEDPDSPECLKWLEKLSALEDLLEEIGERLDE